MHRQTSFRDRIYAVVRTIPRGQVRTYADVARDAGSPRAVRAVGSALKANTDTTVPCHRVIRSDGTLGAYNRGAAMKKRLLQDEGALE